MKRHASMNSHESGDIAIKMGLDYYDAIAGIKNDGTVYTPYNVAKAMADISVGDNIKTFSEDGRPYSKIRCLDPCCGGGVFVIALLRSLHEKTGIDKGMLAEQNIWAYDIDIGGVLCTWRSMEHECGRPLTPLLKWGDTLTGFVRDPAPYRQYDNNIAACMKLNGHFDVDNRAWVIYCNAEKINPFSPEGRAAMQRFKPHALVYYPDAPVPKLWGPEKSAKPTVPTSYTKRLTDFMEISA